MHASVKAKATYPVDYYPSVVYGYGINYDSWNPSTYQDAGIPDQEALWKDKATGETCIPDGAIPEVEKTCFIDDYYLDNGYASELVLDIYKPKGDQVHDAPIMVIFRGFGFDAVESTKNDDMVAFGQYFAERGWVVFVPTYRGANARNGKFGAIPQAYYDLIHFHYSNIHTLNIANINLDEIIGSEGQAHGSYVSARDSKAALRWIHANASRFGGNSENITAYGASSGAMIAIMLGVTNSDDFHTEIDETVDPTLIGNNPHARSDVHTVISHGGGTTLLKLRQWAFDGGDRMDASDAPTQLVVGTSDPYIIPFGKRLQIKMKRQGIHTDLINVPRSGHADMLDFIANNKTLFEHAFSFIVNQQDLRVDKSNPNPSSSEFTRFSNVDITLSWHKGRRYDPVKGCK